MSSLGQNLDEETFFEFYRIGFISQSNERQRLHEACWPGSSERGDTAFLVENMSANLTSLLSRRYV